MARLAMHQPDARSGARLSAALSEAHRLERCVSWSDLLDRLSSGTVEGGLVDADHPTPDEALTRIERLRGEFPDLVLIGFTERTHPVEYYRMGRTGLEAFVAETDGPLATRSAVDDALSIRRGRVVRRVLRKHLPPPGPDAVGWALTRAGTGVDTDDLARALGFSTYELRDILHERALPAPSVLLHWGRLLAAAGRLHGDGRKVEETAFAVGYASAPSLTRALRTRAGLTPREVAEGGLPELLGILVSSIRGLERPLELDDPIIPTAAPPSTRTRP